MLTLTAPRSLQRSVTSVATPAAAATFSAEKNPYLFPTALLEDVEMRLANSTSTELVDAAQPLPVSLDEAPWWLVHTKPRQEKQLAHQLRSLEISHFLPAAPHRAMTRGRVRLTWAPLFPSYLFFRGLAEARLSVLQTNRIVAIHPVADTLSLSCQLRVLAELVEKNIPLRVEERFPPGRNVRVIAGALLDTCGVVVQRCGKTRLFIKISELLGGVSVEIDHRFVEPY
ncbi:transcriptional activator RfaH [Lacipirellula limnantheis]|uniref:Transcriptional activator RfaH n=2 Tax=Lacipirellula limnantheis TaxID=2528024 RepID=A0A517TY84_9BACT|nr:transcriptional activator RfaH [Lacipirellula limnantheis]